METHETCVPPPREPAEDKTPPKVRNNLRLTPIRKRIVEQVQDKPGINQNQLTQTLSVSSSTINDHLIFLNKTGHVITVIRSQTSEKLCFTPENYHVWKAEPFRVLLGRATPRKVALYLTQNPGATTKQIALDLGISISTIQRHLRRLKDADLICGTRIARMVLYHARRSLVEWMRWVQKEEGVKWWELKKDSQSPPRSWGRCAHKGNPTCAFQAVRPYKR